MPRLLIVEDDGDLQQVLSFAFNRDGEIVWLKAS